MKNAKTILSLLFSAVVLCYTILVISLENPNFSKEKTILPEKTTINTEILADAKDSISFVIMKSNYPRTKKNPNIDDHITFYINS